VRKIIAGGLLLAGAVAICVAGISILDAMEDIVSHVAESDYDEPGVDPVTEPPADEEDPLSPVERQDA
jgi:hypothetical protein